MNNEKTKLKKFAESYFRLSKKGNDFLERVSKKEVEKQKRAFFINYKIEPTEEEINEFKKNAIMRKGIVVCIFIFLFFVGIRTIL